MCRLGRECLEGGRSPLGHLSDAEPLKELARRWVKRGQLVRFAPPISDNLLRRVAASADVLVRDTLDAFKLGGYRAEFELVEQDRYTSGGTRQVLHYVPFEACVSRPPPCDLSDASCSTDFQAAPFTDECSVAPGGSSPASNSFYDRSLLGEWTLLLDSASFAALGDVRAVEVTFMATGTVI
ncbi:hypothetical protein ACLESO_50070 [Pyxidicoccus sp. 3LG]